MADPGSGHKGVLGMIVRASFSTSGAIPGWRDLRRFGGESAHGPSRFLSAECGHYS
jgi:hypothetical protein